MEHLIAAISSLRDARACLILHGAIEEADLVETSLHRCEALKRACERARTLRHEEARKRKATKRHGAVR